MKKSFSIKGRFFHRGSAAGIVSTGLKLHIDAGNAISYPGSGTSVFDMSGNNVTGSLINGTSHANGAFVFDGSNDIIDFGNTNLGINAGASAISISTWIKPRVFNNASGFVNGIIARVNANGPSPAHPYGGWMLGTYVINSKPGIDFAINVSGTWSSFASNFDILPGGGLFTNTWYQAVGVFDGSTVKLYVNGMLISSRSVSGTIQYASNLGNLMMGRNFSQGAYDGSIADVMIYDIALTQNQVSQNYNATKNRFGIN